MEDNESTSAVEVKKYLVDNSLHIKRYNEFFQVTITVDKHATITVFESEKAYDDMAEYLAAISTTHVNAVILTRIDAPDRLLEFRNIQTCKHFVLNDIVLNSRLLQFMQRLPLDSLMAVCSDRKIAENWMYYDVNNELPRKLKMVKFHENSTMFETLLQYQNEESGATVDEENIKKLLDVVWTELAEHPETNAFHHALVKTTESTNQENNNGNNMPVFEHNLMIHYGTSKLQYYQKIISELTEAPDAENIFQNPHQFLHTLYISDIPNPELLLDSGIRRVENLVFDGFGENQASIMQSVKFKKLFLLNVHHWNFDANNLRNVEQLHAGAERMPTAFFNQLRCQSLLLTNLDHVDADSIGRMFFSFINRGTAIFQNNDPIILAFSIRKKLAWNNMLNAIHPIITYQRIRFAAFYREIERNPENAANGFFIHMPKFPGNDNGNNFELGHLIIYEGGFVFYSLARQTLITPKTARSVLHEYHTMLHEHHMTQNRLTEVAEQDDEWKVVYPKKLGRMNGKRSAYDQPANKPKRRPAVVTLD